MSCKVVHGSGVISLKILVTSKKSRVKMINQWWWLVMIFPRKLNGTRPGRIAQSVCQGSWVRYPVWQHTFVSPSAFSRRAVVSYWQKYVHEVLVNHLGGLSLPRKSVVRLTDRPDMTLDVDRGRKTTMQQQQQINATNPWLRWGNSLLLCHDFNDCTATRRT